MNMAFDFRMPQSIPHVSRLRRVLEEATARNCWRSCEGRKTGRRGSPFSRYAEGLKEKSSSSVEGVGGRLLGTLLGTGGREVGGSAYFPGTGGGRRCSKVMSRGAVGGLGGKGGGIDGTPEDL
jgi:hypothetical protein